MADKFTLLTGVDATRYPAPGRTVLPSGGGAPGTFRDGDRLAGTSPQGPVIAFQGLGTPYYTPNQFGAMSFLFHRGSVPFANLPFMGIDFMGGPLLDLDGDLSNGSRSLTPTDPNSVPVEIPGTTSFIDLEFDLNAGSVTLANIDATANNEGAPQVQAETATVVVTIAGTQPDGSHTGPINPLIDTRVGSVFPFFGSSNTLKGVHRIDDLGFEIWYDSIDPSSSTSSELGTFQYFGEFRGWLVKRNPVTGWPTLAGQGLGSTLWPLVDTSAVGAVFNTATGASPTATISTGTASDNYTAANNGGLALTAFGGDLGAYFDTVVIPQLGAHVDRFVYLEAAGWGVNNSPDPVFLDTIGYDIVIIGASRSRLDSAGTPASAGRSGASQQPSGRLFVP